MAVPHPDPHELASRYVSLIEQAAEHARAGRADEALALLADVGIEYAPHMPDLMLAGVGTLHYQTGNPHAAVSWLQQVRRHTPASNLALAAASRAAGARMPEVQQTLDVAELPLRRIERHPLPTLPAGKSACDVCPRPGSCCGEIELHGPAGAMAFRDAAEAREFVRDQGYPFTLLGARRIGDNRYTHVFECTALGEDGRCTRYEDRPKLCRDLQPGSGGLCVFRGRQDLVEVDP